MDGPSQQFMFGELRAGLTPYDPRGIWAMGLPGASIQNAGRGWYNPSPNNMLWSNGGGDGGDELEDLGGNAPPSADFCTAQTAALGMGCNATGTSMTSAMARSMHIGGVNMAMADGSVRFVSNSVDQLTFIRLEATQDGQVVSGDF